MGHVSQDLLDELVRRVVAVASPVRIILFGSAARGQMGPDSDLDVLVVVKDGVHRRHTAQAIYRNMIGFGAPVDVVVVTQGDMQRHGDSLGLIIKPALEEGQEIYAA